MKILTTFASVKINATFALLRSYLTIVCLRRMSILHLPRATNVLLPTDLLSTNRRRQIMGKGIADIVARQSSGSEGRYATDGGDISSQLGAWPRTDEPPTADILSDNDRAHDTMSEEEGGKKDGAGVDKRIHLLDIARRWMADAGTKVAAACRKALAATEPDATRRAGVEG